ncbi:hypothetical protein LTR53_000781 [Teratosphaeriaceae sp. CCFEE 6253]|nr:hypothetical protein LTR53_000781 [Teratosphaeriaceae sp. CCFEE 6253]
MPDFDAMDGVTPSPMSSPGSGATFPATSTSKPLRRGPGGRPHSEDLKVQHRAEIEARTLAGESCKQISAALLAAGHEVLDKSPLARPRKDTPREPRPRGSSRRSAQKASRDVVTQLHAEGKSAEEIHDILQARGVVLKKGVSTVWRLLTYWKIVPYDSQRANGTGVWNKWRMQPGRQKPAQPRQPKEKRAKNGAASAVRQVQVPDGRTLHYPNDCAFGPRKPTAGASLFQRTEDPPWRAVTTNDDDTEHIGLDSEPDQGSYHAPDDDDVPSTEHQQSLEAWQRLPGAPRALPATQTPPATQATDVSNVPPTNATSPAVLTDRTTQEPYGPRVAFATQASSVDQPDRLAQSTQIARHPQPAHRARPQPAIPGSADIMSAEILVDLATSSLQAANTLKNLMLAVQMQRPAKGSLGALPPSMEDVAAARRKVREAAVLVMDLAMG